VSYRVICFPICTSVLTFVSLTSAPNAAAQQPTTGTVLAGASAGLPGTLGAHKAVVETAGLDIFLNDAKGAPIPAGAVVTLLNLAGQPYRRETAKNNYIRFNAIAPTEYTVQVIMPGYETVVKNIDTHGQTSTKLTIELRALSAAEAAFQREVAKLPPKAQKEMGKVVTALRDNETGKAREHLDALLRLAPNHAEANYLYGVYSQKSSNETQAKSYWSKTLEIDPTHLGALLSLSEAALKEKKNDEAFALAWRAVDADPSSWRAHALLAGACSQRNELDDTIKHAERALELGQAQASMVQPVLAGALARQGNQDRAVSVLKSYVHEHSGDEGARKQLEELEHGPAAGAGTGNNDATIAAAAAAATAMPLPSNWLPPDVDEKMPAVEAAPACAVDQVIAGVGSRLQEFVGNLDKFTASEVVRHEGIDKWGVVSSTENAKFDYLASVQQARPGIYNFEEYRNFRGGASQVFDVVGTYGLPGMAMIFHPDYVKNFDVQCEGATRWNGTNVWQVHFRQRADKPNLIRHYRIGMDGPSHPVAMKGRAWIAADSYQIMRLETDLVVTLPEIRLFADHTIIEYGPVHFRQSGQDMWLPQSAEVYYDWKGKRVHRRHTFSDYLLFSVGDKQRISLPPSTEPPPPNDESHF